MTQSTATRREVLAGSGAVLAGAATGCVGRTSAAGDGPVSILAAGSLNNALENGLKSSVEHPIRVEAHGSAQVARLVAGDKKSPDIVSVADTALFEEPLRPSWHAEFATNAVVVAYDPETEGGSRVAAAGPDAWYEPLLSGAATLGRTDPDLDPLGYRTLFLFDLATTYYDTDVDLRAELPAREQIYPETQLVSQFETGAIDAAITYRNMAVERGYEYVELPAEIDLSTPAYADRYASATYSLPSGKTVRGGPITYGATVPDGRGRDAVFDVFETHVSGSYLDEFGFGVPESLPRFTGDVPRALSA